MRVARDRAPRSDRGLDHRRYVLSQAGHAFGWRASSILRATRQTGELPSGGDALDRESPCQLADRLSAVSAADMGGRPSTPQEDARPQSGEVPDQAADRAQTNPGGVE